MNSLQPLKQRGMLFTAPMVCSLLDGSKTQTRRLYKVRRHPDTGCEIAASELVREPQHVIDRMCPYGRPGDLLWVRETWADLEELSGGNFQRQAVYRADDIERYGNEDEYVDVTAADMRWRPSIHMPRWASRILLEVTRVRVERLQDIGSEEIQAEGVVTSDADIMEHGCRARVIDFSKLWESMYGAGSWDANPWLWVVEFRRIEP